MPNRPQRSSIQCQDEGTFADQSRICQVAPGLRATSISEGDKARVGLIPDGRGSGDSSPDNRNWHRSLAAAIRDPDVLIDRLALPEKYREPARRAGQLFPVMVPESLLRRMERGNPFDPLLRQVLPLDAEFAAVPGFTTDAVEDATARRAPGLLQKYAGRALLIATGSCAVHCRYCFRRHYPYGDEPRRIDEWEPAFHAIAADDSLREIILSGGDPLMLTDERLGALFGRLDAIPHVRRVRVHSRLPIVLPDRIAEPVLSLLRSYPSLSPVMVVHANHPAEVIDDCAEALSSLVSAGIPTLNQSVLLRGVNDNADVLAELSERLVDVGVMPYYVHQLDPVQGASHFAVTDATALALMERLRARLPGYAVPRLVRDVPGAASKRPVV